MPTILDKLLATPDVSKEELLACGVYRDTGTLALLTRPQLEQILSSSGDEKLPRGMSFERVQSLARFVVERAWLVKHNATTRRIESFDVTAREWRERIIANHYAAQERNAEIAQRRAKNMTDATATVEETTTEKKFAKKGAAKKGAAKGTKAAPTKKGKKTAEEKEAEFNAAMAKPVKAVRKAAEGELPKQAAIIVNTLRDMGKTTVGALIAELTKTAGKDGGIVTKQPIGAIWSFYRARLINDGFIVVTE